MRRLARELERDGNPRAQLLFILLLTGVAGAVASFVMLRAGFDRMWLRYPAAATAGYALFLVALLQWVRWRVTQRAPASGPVAEDDARAPEPRPSSRARKLSDWLELLDPTMFLDDMPAIALLFVAVIVAVAVAGVVLSAPILLAELLLDGLIVAGLWHRVSAGARQFTFDLAVRRTIGPAMFVIVGLAAAGFLLEQVAPGARSIGDVLRGLTG
ncbi:MAG: hypothetical protein R2752_03130 [Vicinamibacterales bacterium]